MPLKRFLSRESYEQYHHELLPLPDSAHTPPAEGVHVRPGNHLSIEETLAWAAGAIAHEMSVRGDLKLFTTSDE